MNSADGSEQFVLGCCLLSQELAANAKNTILPEMFEKGYHADIFNSICGVLLSGGKPDIISVTQTVLCIGGVAGGKRYNDADALRKYLCDCAEIPVAMEHFDYHIREVKRAYYWRKIASQAVVVANDASDDNIAEMQRLAVARSLEDAKSYFHFKRDMPDILSLFEQVSADDTVDTGFVSLDGILKGLRPGELLTVGGRPGGGKTALLTKLALNFAGLWGKRVFMFTTEMTEHEFLRRVIPIRARIEAWKLRKIKHMTPSDYGKMTAACEAMYENLDIFCSGNPRPSLADIRGALVKTKPHILIVDYLQRCAKPKAENVTRQIDAFMTELKSLCLEHRVIGVLGCQMSRSVDHSSGTPRLSDLRDSGSIEAESDQVILLHTAHDKAHESRREIEAHIEKNRHGAMGKAVLMLDAEYVDMTDMPCGGDNADRQVALDISRESY